MVENMFFLDSEDIRMGGMLPPPPEKLLFLLSGCGAETRSSIEGKSAPHLHPPNFPSKNFPFVNSEIVSIDTKGS